MSNRAVGGPAVAIGLIFGWLNCANAAVFFGPTPYLSQADIPVGLYAGGIPTALENFEDKSLDFGITAEPGTFLSTITFNNPIITDSVDGDDGTIDGSGLAGQSWYGSGQVTFFFSGPLPTAAGMVWTDGFGTVSFEAFGPGMVSLGVITNIATPDDNVLGGTGEDRFVGVQDLGGIYAIRMSNTVGGTEVDHVQFGNAATAAVPEPASLAIWGLGALGCAFAGYRWRRTA
jgi:hypothetical protein